MKFADASSFLRGGGAGQPACLKIPRGPFREVPSLFGESALLKDCADKISGTPCASCNLWGHALLSQAALVLRESPPRSMHPRVSSGSFQALACFSGLPSVRQLLGSWLESRCWHCALEQVSGPPPVPGAGASPPASAGQKANSQGMSGST